MMLKHNLSELRSIKIRVGDLSEDFELECEELNSRKNSMKRAARLHSAAFAFLCETLESQGQGQVQKQRPGPNPNPNPNSESESESESESDSRLTDDPPKVESPDDHNVVEEFFETFSHADWVSEDFWIDLTGTDSDFLRNDSSFM
jgi:hypothetical protein